MANEPSLHAVSPAPASATGREGRDAYSYRRDPAVPAFKDDRPVIIFDGYCALCSATAQFVLRHDRSGRFRLLPAQSSLGRAVYVHYGLDPQDYETIILLEDGVAYLKSEASLRIARGLGLPWSLAAAFRAVPRRLRDWCYRLVANNRFRLFGRREVCFRPSKSYQDRFLDQSGF